jgi:hypothetical protein
MLQAMCPDAPAYLHDAGAKTSCIATRVRNLAIGCSKSTRLTASSVAADGFDAKTHDHARNSRAKDS